MTPVSPKIRLGQSLPASIGFIFVAVSLLIIRVHRPQQPVKFIASAPGITLPAQYGSDWYWVERPDDKHASLIRADASGTKKILLQADRIEEFTVASGKILSISFTNGLWLVSLCDINGGSSHTVFSDVLQPHGLFIASNAIIFTRSVPSAVPDAESFPPLGPQCVVMSAPLSKGDARYVATIMEPQADQVVGVTDQDIWVSAYRVGIHSFSTIYRVPQSGGPAEQIVAESGKKSVIITPDGSLYWTSASVEAENTDALICIKRRGRSGKIEILTDWLPSRGKLFMTMQGPIYVDGDSASHAWRLGPHTALAEPISVVDGYYIIAAGQEELLLRNIKDRSENPAIYRMALH